MKLINHFFYLKLYSTSKPSNGSFSAVSSFAGISSLTYSIIPPSLMSRSNEENGLLDAKTCQVVIYSNTFVAVFIFTNNCI